MYFILELLFGIFQSIAYWGKIEGREEQKESTSNKFVVVALVVFLLLVVVLIWRNNPELHATTVDVA